MVVEKVLYTAEKNVFSLSVGRTFCRHQLNTVDLKCNLALKFIILEELSKCKSGPMGHVWFCFLFS